MGSRTGTWDNVGAVAVIQGARRAAAVREPTLLFVNGRDLNLQAYGQNE